MSKVSSPIDTETGEMSKVSSPIFRTKYDGDTHKFLSEKGSKLLPEYKMKVDPETGCEYVAPTGEFTNVYDRIQADYPSTDINLLMERFALGETDVINVKDGFYGDVTAMPTSYAELFQRAEDAHQFFDSLPTDLKEMFNNSYTEFFTEMDRNIMSFNEKIDEYNSRFELSPEFNDPIKSDEKGDENNA